MIFFNAKKEASILENEYQLKHLKNQLHEQAEIKHLKDRIIHLEADLKIERAKTEKIKAELKSEYAEHVIKATEERLYEMCAAWSSYAENLTEIARDSISKTCTVTNSMINE